MALPPVLQSLLQGTPALPRGPEAPATPPGPGGAGAGATGGSVPDDIFSQIANKRFSDSAGADPGMFVSQLKQMKMALLSMLPKIAFRIPNMERHVTAMLRSLDSGLKEAESFASQQVKPQPIANAAAQVPPAGAPSGPGIPA